MFKKSNIFFNIILMLVFVLSTVSPRIASAQFGGALANVAGQLGGGVNLQGVGAVALSCVSSSGALNNIGLPFGGGGDTMDDMSFDDVINDGDAEGITNPTTEINENGETVPFNSSDSQEIQNSQITPANSMAGQTVPTSNPVVDKAIEVIKKNTTTSKTEDLKMSKKERCEDKIARFMVLQAMDKITFSTLEWINSGFEGQPFYIQNPGQFFGDLAGREILGFTGEISGDPNLFPFGDTLKRTIIVSLRRTAQQNMMNSLNAVLAHGTRAEWEYSFSVGGWAGYTAYVEPNNNIFGSYIESSGNLGRRLVGTRTSTALNFQRELDQGLGFLSKRYCAETQHGGTYIPQNSIQHIPGGAEIVDINQIPPNVYQYITVCATNEIYDTDGDGQADSDGLCETLEEDIIAIAEEYRGRSVCTNWQTSTPGHQIAQQTTKVLGMSQDQLLLADEINENLGLIFDALINQFVTKGLSSFYQEGGTYTQQDNAAWAQINGFNPGEPQDAIPLVEALGGTGFVMGEQNDGTDFPGFIALQEEYITKATLLVSKYQEKIQRTRDLDYCVPGPNPSWQSAAAQQAAALLQEVPVFESMPSETWGGAQFWDPGGLFSGIGQSIETAQFYENVNLAYSVIIENLTGVNINENNVDPQIINRNQQFFPIMYQAFEKYAQFINTRFTLANDFDDNLRSKAANFFFTLNSTANRIAQYQNNIETISQSLEDFIELREEYAVIEHANIIQYLQAAEAQGIVALQGQLAIFQSFQPSQITYIGNGNQPSAYHNAVIQLTSIVGEPVVPPVSNPEYADILEEFLEILQSSATEESIEELDDEIETVIEEIGNPSDDDTIVGLIYSCIYQINNPGQGSFTGLFSGRKQYPFPLSSDIPGLLSLPTTTTFLPDVTASSNVNAVTIGVTPASAVSPAQNLQIFENSFMNLGGSLY